MRSLIIALVLLLPLLYSDSAHASRMRGPDFVQPAQNSKVDFMICDKVRYNLGIPKADTIMTKALMTDCLERFSKIPDPRPIFCWQESVEEAERLCTAYTKQRQFDPASDMLLIVETNDFDECMKKELWD